MDPEQFLVEFAHIANAPGGVARLRELILQLAISGRLSEPKGGDTQVTDDIDRADQLRHDYETQRAMRGARLYPRSSPPPYEIPIHWRWVELGRLSLYIQRGRGPTYADGGRVKVISQKCVQWSGFHAEHARFISDSSLKLYGSERFLCDGDLLWNSTGTGTAGRAAIYAGDPAAPVVADSHVTVIRLANSVPRYIWMVLASPEVQSRISPAHAESLVSGSTQQVELATKTVKALPVPLPPIQEQERIVDKVDLLMKLCDRLDTQDSKCRKIRRQALNAIVANPRDWATSRDRQARWSQISSNYRMLFEDPDNLRQLRQLILDLAVAGSLSTSDSADVTATELYNTISRRRQALLTSGAVKRRRLVRPSPLEETQLPDHWTEITLDEAIATIDAGWSPACPPTARASETAWGVLKTTSVQKLNFKPEEHKELPRGLEPRPQYEVMERDILVTRAGPKNRVGICCVVDRAPPRLMISDKIIRLTIIDNLIDPRFVALCLSAGEPGRILEAMKSGMADSQMNISQDKLRSITIPLPPAAEQLRILEAVSALTGLTDQLEERVRARDEVAGRFANAAVASLTGIATAQEGQSVKAPETHLISAIRLAKAPAVKDQAPLAALLARHEGEMSARDLWQRFSGSIDAFYAQLKAEVANGWIAEPAPAEMLEVVEDRESA